MPFFALIFFHAFIFTLFRRHMRFRRIDAKIIICASHISRFRVMLIRHGWLSRLRYASALL